MKRRPPDAVEPRYAYRQTFVQVDRPFMLHGKEVPGLRVRSDPVTIATALPEVPPLTQEQKQRIIEETHVKFLTTDDWHAIDNALCRYVVDVRQTREGDYDEICARLEKVRSCALAFSESVTHKNKADTLAINRLFKVAGEEIYGRISAVVAETTRQIDKTLESAQQERLLPKPDPLLGFVSAIRDIFTARGVSFTCPKANKDYAAPRASQAQTFMRSMLSGLPEEFQPRNIGVGSKSAFMADTARALSRSTKTGRSS